MQVKNFSFLITYKKKLQQLLITEYRQWFLWIPILYSIGILMYLVLPTEPNVYLGITITAISFVTLLLIKKRTLAHYILFALFIVSAGFMGANLRTLYVKAPMLEKEIRISSIKGRIVEISTYKTGHRVILTDIKTEELPQNKIPKNIRLTVLTQIGDAKAGDIIEVRASLSPPPKAVLPDAYNFMQYAYFQQIGAVGFSVSDFNKISQSQNAYREEIEQARNNIADRLEASVKGVEAEIAKALLIGDVGGIDKDTMVAIRNSGLAHLLSISGLHLVLVCVIFFTLSRSMLSLFPSLALNYNIKKIAAFCAIVGSYFYLLISGSPVSAVRSFVMSAMVLCAIMMDRRSTPLRLVAIAAMFILVVSPENILSPSFQMSFGAVIGLIAAFEWLTPHLTRFASEHRIPKIFMSILGTIISSIIATIATAPFGIYHFNRSSPYGILANILAIPATSFIVMPFGMLSIVLMPFHLDWLVAWPLKFGIDFIIYIANSVSSLPYASATIPAINNWQLLLISFGLLWLAIWKTSWRLLGIGFVFIGIGFSFFNKTPDIIISNDGVLFAVKDEYGDLIFSSNKTGRYSRDVWSARSGQEETESIDSAQSNLINCDTSGCNYKNKGYRASFIKHPIALESECENSDLFINLTGIKYNCTMAAKELNIYNLKKDGAHEIFLDNEINIKTVSGGKNRLWD